MSADTGNGGAPGGRERRSNGWSVPPIDRLFELPAIELPGECREIEQLVARGCHAEAAAAIAELPPGPRLDRERAARAQAICLMRAGDPERADLVLRSAVRTAASAWCRACSLVRLGCFVDAADEVVWVGSRVPLLGSERRAARALLGMLGRPLPPWLCDPVEGALVGARRTAPPPYLASFFYPTRPDVPAAFEDAAILVQRGRYAEAARLLADARPTSSKSARRLAVTIAECWLLADEPEAADAWLYHRPTPGATWALVCARVHRNRLEEALPQLAGLARRHGLRGERRDAAAALLSHLGVRSLPPGLHQLQDHPFLDPGRARDAGYRRFAEKVLREVRQGERGSVELIVQRVEAQCGDIPDEAGRSVLLPMYEAAVRVWNAPSLAARGLDLVLSRPELLGSDEAAYSRALVFATACERLPRLRAELQALARRVDGVARFACWMACAKAAMVLGDLPGIKRDTSEALLAATSDADRARARRLRLAAHWLAPTDGPRLSQWQLRLLHHLLPMAVAERLEDRDSAFQAMLDECAAASPGARRAVEAAGRQLRAAARLGESRDGHPRVRRAVGFWALHVGRALLEADRPLDALPFTGAAWRLLHPDLSDDVVATHGRAIGVACRSLEERGAVLASLDAILCETPPATSGSSALAVAALTAWEEARRTSRRRDGVRPEELARLLTPASTHRPIPPLAVAAPVLGDVDTIAPDVRRTLEECFLDRWMLLPDTAPFRGRRWFESDTAHRQYQLGRDQFDTRAAYKAFEEAWLIEPNFRATTQGLILGWGRRLSEKPGRRHVLEHLARILDQVKGREVEAALAYTTLAAHSDPLGGRRAVLEKAAGALERRVRRQPWTRARNAEIALRLELGDVVAAGEAAWAESMLFLPGSDGSTRYALLAAGLWGRSRDSGRPLGDRIRDAQSRAAHPELTNREAVDYAVGTTGRLVALTDLALDEDALEDLWLRCRGDEEDLCRFLEKQGTRPVNPRPHYLAFLARKLVAVDPAAAARIDSLLARERAPDPPGIAWLRLATAELLALDPLEEVATPQKQLAESHLRECIAVLRSCVWHGEVAGSMFAMAVKDALAALFDVREADESSAPEPYGERLGKASDALQDVRWAGRGLGSPAVAIVADLLFRYLALALDRPMVNAYTLQKERRLVPSRMGSSLGSWWADVSEASGPLDFFHYHQSYRYDGEVPADVWLRTHHVHGKPVRKAICLLLETMERHGRRLADIEDGFRSARPRPGPIRDAFGLRAELHDCSCVLRRALQARPEAEDLWAMEVALERLGRALRRIDLARLVDVPNLLYDNALPTGQYVLPRATELLDHLRRNVKGAGSLQAICEVADDSGREVSCLLTLDGDGGPAPESTPLRGLAPFADLVQALGGQFHLWMARPGERSGCRLQHDDGLVCLADDYVPRIEERLRQLTRARWRSQRQAVEPWLHVLDAALSARGGANLAFVLLPRMHE